MHCYHTCYYCNLSGSGVHNVSVIASKHVSRDRNIYIKVYHIQQSTSIKLMLSLCDVTAIAAMCFRTFLSQEALFTVLQP